MLQASFQPSIENINRSPLAIFIFLKNHNFDAASWKFIQKTSLGTLIIDAEDQIFDLQSFCKHIVHKNITAESSSFQEFVIILVGLSSHVCLPFLSSFLLCSVYNRESHNCHLSFFQKVLFFFKISSMFPETISDFKQISMRIL